MDSCCHASRPREIASFLVRVSFGCSLFFVGLAHYMTMSTFQSLVADGLGPLSPLGMAWAYVLPALMIVGGILFILGRYVTIAVWTVGIALGSVPVGMLSKTVLSGVGVVDMMPAAVNAFIWLLIYLLVIYFSSIGPSSAHCEECAADSKKFVPKPVATKKKA